MVAVEKEDKEGDKGQGWAGTGTMKGGDGSLGPIRVDGMMGPVRVVITDPLPS